MISLVSLGVSQPGACRIQVRFQLCCMQLWFSSILVTRVQLVSTFFGEPLNGLRLFKHRKWCVKPTSCSILWEHGGVLCSEFRSLLESSVWCCYCMKFHWIKVLPWWRWKSRDWSWWREKGKCWCVRQILGNLIFPNTDGEGKEASYVRVYFNVQLSVVMKVDKTGFTEPWLCRICCKGSDI